ncbi:MAG: TetR/AcrR family transcriptional regulator [Gammaproteobacteria bacterium]|nr:TetR/AcrR family transcriptional regulator [Gammaproteobacteria bacterium]
MPYTGEHKQQSRQRILESAYRLFSSRGYDNVSINEIMNEASMTRGGFYAHFENKSALYQESIRYAASVSGLKQNKPESVDGESWIHTLLEGYLHKQNLDGECQCPLASLATDVAVRDPQIRKAYTETFKGMNAIIQKYVDTYSDCERQGVMATTAMMIGGLAVARALNDKRLAEELLEACKQEAINMLNGATIEDLLVED